MSGCTHILLLCPDAKDATSFYRGWGPFGELVRQSSTPMMLHPLPYDRQVSWATMVDKSLVVLQRPCQDSHLEVLEIARRHGVRTWVDWDDLLWQIPDGNPAKDYYHTSSHLYKIILQCALMADIVTVSSPFFKHAFPDEVQPKITVLRNRLPHRWRCRTPHQKAGTPIKMAWRGSRTHDMDWIDFIDTAVSISQALPVEWHLIGSPPQWIKERLASVSPVKLYHEIPMERYFEWFIQEGPQADILFVPLRESAFNRAKSHIALLEATFAGMLCVAPKWEEWKTGIAKSDAFLYTSPEQAGACLETACEHAQRGAFALINTLQDHFLTCFEEEDTRFHRLVFHEEE